MRVIGLTGGIGTGKSEVSRILQGLGAEIISADRLGHEVYRQGTEAWREIVEAFGDDVLAPSSEVDRQKLGAAVFSDPEALGRLNRITHHRIYDMVAERIEKARARSQGAVVVEAALLLEARWDSLVDEIWVTTSTDEQVIERLRTRNQLDDTSIRARVSSQMPQSERVRRADVVIENAGALESLREQVSSLWTTRIVAAVES